MTLVDRLWQRIGDFRKKIKRILDDLLFVAGIILISIGVYQIYIPAGYIALGIFLIITAVLWSRGAEVDDYDIQEALSMKKDIPEDQFAISKLLVR